MSDTIFALASAPGRAGVAVVRVSGPEALRGLCVLSGKSAGEITPRKAFLATLKDVVSRETIDEALVLYFQAPHSFTGEDVVEYHIHGGRAVRESLFKALVSSEGCRMAQPGEFTRRAFQNGRMDLTRAEAIADLVNAETALQKTQALHQMGGGLQALYEGWAERLTRALAYIEADLDFPDEDLPEGVGAAARPDLSAIYEEVARHLDDNRRGERLREGVRVAVVGPPNAGKSSLVNALTQRDIAIVSPVAGTTRDLLEAHIDLAGVPVTLIDTAGLRPDQLGDADQDTIEREGIRRALQAAQDADLRLYLFDGATLPEIDQKTRLLAHEDNDALVAVGKADCLPQGENSALPDDLASYNPIIFSTETGASLDRLLAQLSEKVAALAGGAAESPTITRARHRAHLEAVSCHLKVALAAYGAPEAKPPELLAEDVRLAARELGHITGRVDVEDLLDVIFRDFCIGK